MAAIKARYAHTNVVAKDWRALVKFYVEVFGCTPAGPERNHRGTWIGEVVAVPDAAIDGIHLRFPGHGDTGPTLEVFTYADQPEHDGPMANRPGFAHIAFEVDDVEDARAVVLAHGGKDLGKTHTRDVPGDGRITLHYMTDPEGNIVELQRWER